jgi:hypothetical protein
MIQAWPHVTLVNGAARIPGHSGRTSPSPAISRGKNARTHDRTHVTFIFGLEI